MKWTPEIIEFIKEEVPHHTWPNIAEAVSSMCGEEVTPNLCRASYMYHTRKDNIDSLVTQARQKVDAKQLNSMTTNEVKALINTDDVLKAVKEAVNTIKKQKVHNRTIRLTQKESPISDDLLPMTVEILFSDLQIGKKSEEYNTNIAKNRVKEYARAAELKMKQHLKNYKIERLVISFLGDIIESSKKHSDSANGTDTSTIEQIQNAIETIYIDFLCPILAFAWFYGIENIDIIGLPGNHDHDGHGIPMSQPGRECYTWIIYNTLAMLVGAECENKNVKWSIPNGYTANIEVYGHLITYEHGYGLKCDEKSMRDMKAKRMDQLRRHITFFRMGDKHNVSRFDCDTLVCNGAFFGYDQAASEYSGILGFSAVAAQMMYFYVPRQDNRLPIYDSFMVQLQHVV